MSKEPLSKLGTYILGFACLTATAGELPHTRNEGQAVSLNGQDTSCPTTQITETAPPHQRGTPVKLSADRAERDEAGVVTLQGEVKMKYGSHTVNADLLRYHEASRQIQASSNVRIENDQLIVESLDAQLNLDSGYFKSSSTTYRYKPLHARGKADSIERVSDGLVELENTTYTTCEKGDNSWELAASELELDKSSGDGTGKDVLVKFKGVPVFYTPWIRFPIDNTRRSGFLTPTFSNSNDSGVELEIPWYWNIAANRDAVLASRLLSDRGLQLKSGFRHLSRKGLSEVGIEYLDDDEFKDERYLTLVKHQGFLTPRTELDILYNRVSDERYFEDLGNALGYSSTQFIEQYGRLAYRSQHWEFTGHVQSFQSVDQSLPNKDKPFKRLPQLKLNGNYPAVAGGINISSESEWVRFQHDDKTDGERLHLGIKIEHPFEDLAYFVRPGVHLSHTRYDLRRKDDLDDEPTRSLPSIYLDAGLIFERRLNQFGGIQTLEPRMYYLHTPFRDQTDIPVFDTAEYEFEFEQLFRNSRFSGHDRIEEADHLSVGLTSRILDLEDGKEKMQASLGRIFYFRDRKTGLPGNPVEREQSSQVAAELKIGLSDRWEAIASTLLDTHNDHTERNSLRFQYRSDNNLILNIAYRYRHRDLEPVDPETNLRQSLEQSDFSMLLPVNDNWRAAVRWNYDLVEKRNLELLAGLEYDTCCWKLRLAGRRYSQNTDEDYNNSIELQLVLKGLGQIGAPLGELLERGVRGYDDRDSENYF